MVDNKIDFSGTGTSFEDETSKPFNFRMKIRMEKELEIIKEATGKSKAEIIKVAFNRLVDDLRQGKIDLPPKQRDQLKMKLK